MSKKTQDIEAQRLREMTAEETHAIAGGPQVINDTTVLTDEEVAAVAGGPEVLNDGPPT
ncbi:hypothetical protein [Roseateles chitosanitabidus]|uniref:hypothetical protein n=1 Tax=Roseateles chitosanitabidus TaxID=65048 RepID=UPI00147138B5|nr:hypothetical protein [Roseateles chitosanitabidus]MBO9688375.1 hypothetical protein [Roseateles chitosanitabidus]